MKEEDKKLVIEPVPDILELRGIFHSAVEGKKPIPFRKIRKAFGEYMARRHLQKHS